MDPKSGSGFSSPASTSSNSTSVRSTSSAFSANAHPDEDWTKISDLAERRRIQNRIAQRNYRRKLKRKLENLEQRSQSNSVSPEPKHEDFDVGNTRTHQRKRSHTIRDPQPNANSASRLSPDVAQSQYLYQPESWTTSPPQQLRQHSLSPQPRYYSSGHSRDYLTYPPSSQYHTAHLMSTCSSAASDASMYQFATASAATTSPRTLPSMVFPEKDDLIAEPDSNAFGISFEGPSTTDPMYLQPFQGPDTHTPALSVSDTFDYFSAASPSDSYMSYPRTPASMPGSPFMNVFSYYNDW